MWDSAVKNEDIWKGNRRVHGIGRQLVELDMSYQNTSQLSDDYKYEKNAINISSVSFDLIFFVTQTHML